MQAPDDLPRGDGIGTVLQRDRIPRLQQLLLREDDLDGPVLREGSTDGRWPEWWKPGRSRRRDAERGLQVRRDGGRSRGGGVRPDPGGNGAIDRVAVRFRSEIEDEGLRLRGRSPRFERELPPGSIRGRGGVVGRPGDVVDETRRGGLEPRRGAFDPRFPPLEGGGSDRRSRRRRSLRGGDRGGHGRVPGSFLRGRACLRRPRRRGLRLDPGRRTVLLLLSRRRRGEDPASAAAFGKRKRRKLLEGKELSATASAGGSTPLARGSEHPTPLLADRTGRELAR
mmetsp:Transcript_25444/g.59580  ORF Transcript_25444/g.59580 Transcript_25444/m.59580 type:complete len:282 (+) Transcript_25444:551-1396(+)